MNEQQIQDIADRLIAALENMVPSAPGWWVIASPIAVFLAAGVAAVIGWRNLKKQQTALDNQQTALNKQQAALEQNSEADARAEWWKRVQWALEATTSEDAVMQDYGDAFIDILAKSDLAGKEERLMLDAVWQDSSTKFDGDAINELVDGVRAEQEGIRELTEEPEYQIPDSAAHPVDDEGDPGDNEGKKEGPDA